MGGDAWVIWPKLVAGLCIDHGLCWSHWLVVRTGCLVLDCDCRQPLARSQVRSSS